MVSSSRIDVINHGSKAGAEGVAAKFLFQRAINEAGQNKKRGPETWGATLIASRDASLATWLALEDEPDPRYN